MSRRRPYYAAYVESALRKRLIWPIKVEATREVGVRQEELGSEWSGEKLRLIRSRCQGGSRAFCCANAEPGPFTRPLPLASSGGGRRE